ncbi:MAG: hypothetical protein PHG64_11840 [Paludibacter sp.]|nr:hypothetical protein [Paludibacter sp.]
MNTAGQMSKGSVPISPGSTIHRMAISRSTCPAQANKAGAYPEKPYE